MADNLKERIAEMKAAALNAETPGPWRASDLGPCDGWQISGGPKDECVVSDSGDLWEQDALFIAAANPAAVLALIAEIGRLNDEVERLQVIERAWDEKFN